MPSSVLGRFTSCVQELLKKFLVHCISLVTHMVHCEIVLGAMLYVRNVTQSICIKTVLKDVAIILEVNAAPTRLFPIISNVE